MRYLRHVVTAAALAFVASLAYGQAWWSPPADGTPNLDNRVAGLEAFVQAPAWPVPVYFGTTVTSLGPVYLGTTAGSLTTGGTGDLIARHILGCADVRAFGAVGNGTHDDTSAIQAAINSFGTNGGPICLPVGIFKITGTLTGKIHTSLIGQGAAAPVGFTVADNATILDARSLGDVTAYQGAGNSVGTRFQDFAIWGPAGSANSHGIDPGHGSRDVYFRSVQVYGFRFGFYVDTAQDLTFLACGTQNQIWFGQGAAGLLLSGAGGVAVIGGKYANASGYNIWITGGSFAVHISGQTYVDEAFSSASVKPAPILIDNASDIVIDGIPILYYGHGGYGIRLGNGTNNPTRVTLRDIKVQRFSVSDPPIAAIEIRGSGHTLDNVYANVDPDGGTTGAIVDLATDTRWFRVTAKTSPGVTTYTALQDPGLLTTVAPGSKRIYYDAGGFVRFAP